MVKNINKIIGIDEAGRGPLAGPVAVGVVIIYSSACWGLLRGIKDSKKLSFKKREMWFSLAKNAKNKGELNFSVSLISSKFIDKYGISKAINMGIKRSLTRLGAQSADKIFLDGALKAPSNFYRQTTVVRGDEKIPAISLASICAKVTRDRYMNNISKKYPNFKFNENKGYGTYEHIISINKYGITDLHRKSFLKKLTYASTNYKDIERGLDNDNIGNKRGVAKQQKRRLRIFSTRLQEGGNTSTQ